MTIIEPVFVAQTAEIVGFGHELAKLRAEWFEARFADAVERGGVYPPRMSVDENGLLLIEVWDRPVDSEQQGYPRFGYALTGEN